MKNLKKLTLNELRNESCVLCPSEQMLFWGGDKFNLSGGTIEEKNGGVLLETNDGYSCFFSGINITTDTVLYNSAFQLNGTIHIDKSWLYASTGRFSVDFFLHEFGHYLQQKEVGTFSYIVNYAIPSAVDSVLNSYYHMNSPIEKDATEQGYKFYMSHRRAK